jgi:hypothetical protein
MGFGGEVLQPSVSPRACRELRSHRPNARRAQEVRDTDLIRYQIPRLFNDLCAWKPDKFGRK